MLLPKLEGWRRLWALLSACYFIPAALITTFVAYYEGIAQAVFVGILIFAAPVALVYFLVRWVDLLYRGFANRRA